MKQPKAIIFEKMQMIHAEMLAEIGTDVDALELYDELIKIATRYATIRANWLLLSREEKNEQDSGRTSCHNSVIIHFNMLARYLKQQGNTAAWRDKLGYEEDDPYNRKAIGDFACYLAFVNGINAR
ncbi:MAG: hypothetical protein PUG26_08625 [Oscillospiraceae bacterium]|nr:hypothetical protein [Oscillospiraceae bacterium]